MDPIAFSIGKLTIHWYGICMALSMLTAAYISTRLLKSHGRDGDLVWDGLFWIILSGIAGARLVYVMTNIGQYFGDGVEPWKVFAVWEGGLSFHGGVIAGLLATWIFFRDKGIPFLEIMDSFSPGVALGIVIVRIGNFMNGDILGYEWTGPWAMNFPHDELHFLQPDAIIPRHPTELYGMAVGLFSVLVCIVMWTETYKTRRFAVGATFFSFILTYSLVRSVIEEPFRNVPLYFKYILPSEAGFGLFTLTQIVSLLLILIALWGFSQIRNWERARSASPAISGKSRQVRRAEKRTGKR